MSLFICMFSISPKVCLQDDELLCLDFSISYKSQLISYTEKGKD